MGAIDTKKHQISLWQICTLSAAFIVGLIVHAQISKLVGKEALSFTTIELIAFTLSVLLAGASIILAIVAINLGRSSEYAIIQRSDESIRLQTDVFQKTMEALQRIESSTGVTEKRIEDIIAGRAGEVSARLAELSTGKGQHDISKEELEKVIRATLLRSSGATSEEDSGKKHKERMALLARYKKYQQKVLLTFANLPNAIALKLGDGSFQGEGFELLDGVFQINNHTIGISVFTGTDKLPIEYIAGIARCLADKQVDRVVFAFDGDPNSVADIVEKMKQALSQFKGDVDQAVTILIGTEETIGDRIAEVTFRDQ